MRSRTQVGIVGAGPAGLMLSHLLHLAGIESVVLESRSRAYVRERVRAGVLEQGVVELMQQTGVGERVSRLGIRMRGIDFRFGGEPHLVEFSAASGGRYAMVWPQPELVEDLANARVAAGGEILYESPAKGFEDVNGNKPTILFGQNQRLQCDFIAGCDGFHGISRGAIPSAVLKEHDHIFPFGWLGVLAEAPPAWPDITWGCHPREFAMMSMRTPTMTRLYLQCPPDDDAANWSDDRIWTELHERLDLPGGTRLNEGRIVQKGVAAMRSYVAEPMRYGRLFLAGDAAHIVPPTGAKGLNLAASDVLVLGRALKGFYGSGRTDWLDEYSDICLRRVWKAQRFSWWMTSTLHRSPDETAFDHQRQIADLDYLTSSRAAMTSLAEQYVGLPAEVSFESAGLRS
ncbi:MAG TPA: 4-hydroxybenzoate 3-monooxygenase [Burkholderiales bacterium]